MRRSLGRAVSLLLLLTVTAVLLTAFASAADTYSKTVKIKSTWDDGDELTVKFDGIVGEEDVRLYGETVHVYQLKAPQLKRVSYYDLDGNKQTAEVAEANSSITFVSSTSYQDMHLHDNFNPETLEDIDVSDIRNAFRIVGDEVNEISALGEGSFFVGWPYEKHITTIDPLITDDVIFRQGLVYGKYNIYYSLIGMPGSDEFTVRADYVNEIHDNGYPCTITVTNNTGKDASGYYGVMFYSDKLDSTGRVDFTLVPFRAELRRGESISISTSGNISDWSKEHRKVVEFESKAEYDKVLSQLRKADNSYFLPRTGNSIALLKSLFGLIVR